MATLKLSPPWVIFYKEVNAMFEYDPQVHVIYDEDANHIQLYVEDNVKAEALSKLLPAEKSFGNINVKISVVPPNDENVDLDNEDYETLFEMAFDGNSIFAFAKSLPSVFFSIPMTYIVFRKQVAQFWTDNLSDYYGLCSTLYQDIALDIFGEIKGVSYSTDVENPVYKNNDTSIEWP